MRLPKILNPGERALLRAAFSSFSTRLKSKVRRLLHREKSGDSNSNNASTGRPIWLYSPSITYREIMSLMNAMTSGWDRSPVQQFEQMFARYLGTTHALATANCTGAIHLALKAMGIGPGDEVLVPESTWIATASAVMICGATPVFVDVDPSNWGMDPASARRAITPRTRAMIPVHLYGQIGDMAALNDIAREAGLRIIEDAAAAAGSARDGRKAGTFGHAAAFSFHSTKILTTAEGGMLVTADTALFDRVVSLANHGVKDFDHPKPQEVGLNYKMSHLQAGVGIAQLERIEELLDRKRRIFGWYKARLEHVNGLGIGSDATQAGSNRWMSVAMLDEPLADQRDSIISALKAKQINAAPFTAPLSSLPMFQTQHDRNPVAYRLARRGILLPSALDLTEADIDRICSVLLERLA